MIKSLVQVHLLLLLCFALIQGCVSPASLQDGRVLSMTSEDNSFVVGGTMAFSQNVDSTSGKNTYPTPQPIIEARFIVASQTKFELSFGTLYAQLRRQIVGDKNSRSALSVGCKFSPYGFYNDQLVASVGIPVNYSLISRDTAKSSSLNLYFQPEILSTASFYNSGFSGSRTAYIRINAGVGASFHMSQLAGRIEGIISLPFQSFASPQAGLSLSIQVPEKRSGRSQPAINR